jgi:hypothetical protein
MSIGSKSKTYGHLVRSNWPGFEKTLCFHVTSNTTTSFSRASLNLTTNLFKIQYKKIPKIKMYSKYTFWISKTIGIFSFNIYIVPLKNNFIYTCFFFLNYKFYFIQNVNIAKRVFFIHELKTVVEKVTSVSVSDFSMNISKIQEEK